MSAHNLDSIIVTKKVIITDTERTMIIRFSIHIDAVTQVRISQALNNIVYPYFYWTN
jgi:hypothetical protein